MGRWLVLLVESVMHWLWSTEAYPYVLSHDRIDVASIDDQIFIIKMAMHLRQKLLWLVLERWQHLLLIHALPDQWLILLGGHVEVVIRIIHIVFDFVELGFKLRFLVIHLEKRVGSFHQLSVIGCIVTAIKGHGPSLVPLAGWPISAMFAAGER